MYSVAHRRVRERESEEKYNKKYVSEREEKNGVCMKFKKVG